MGFRKNDDEPATLRTLWVIPAGLTFLLLALCELVLAFPVAWWLYVSVVLAFAAALVERAPLRRQPRRLGALAAITAIAATLYLVDWSTRKPFLRDLNRIKVGMSEAEVRQIMARYMTGTGWPASAGDGRQTASGTLSIVGSTSQYSTTVSSSGELQIRNAIVFRHSNDGAFDSDWGIVTFVGSRVVRVEFSRD